MRCGTLKKEQRCRSVLGNIQKNNFKWILEQGRRNHQHAHHIPLGDESLQQLTTHCNTP